ncbi:hypothetical protein AB0O86_34320 [Streptomyces hirsutus]|uniref:hypothetical protein n=1 Tax=Streptomyces hirsutus TaxID=35620 RepID=UPI003415BA66
MASESVNVNAPLPKGPWGSSSMLATNSPGAPASSSSPSCHSRGVAVMYRRRRDGIFWLSWTTAHGITGEEADRVWTAIALHTTPEIPLHMAPEIALVTRGVELDVLGIGYRAVSDEERAAVVEAHPRPDFKNRILAAFTEGIKDRPETTFGNVKADVLAHYVPGFVRGDFGEVIKNSAWPE